MQAPTATVVVATHKKYNMPKDPMYLPMYVGVNGRKEDYGYARDDSVMNSRGVRDNGISDKNPKYCELTGLYAAWKMIDSDYIGLVHYRRHFLSDKYKKIFEKKQLKSETEKFKGVLSSKELGHLLKKYSVIVPAKRNYYVETLYTHYGHTHYSKHLDMTRDVIKDRSREYLRSFDKVMNSRGGYMFNMMIMKKELVDDYCSWLFDILFELEKRIEELNEKMSAFQERLYGRISELLFNVWLEKKIGTESILEEEIKELPYIYMGEVDYVKKAKSFLAAKLFHKKYDSSF